MTHKILPMLLILAVLTVALTAGRYGVHAQGQRPLLVVVASMAGIADISSAMLRRAFQGYPAEYRSGKRFLPLNHPIGTTERTRFDRAVLGLGPDEIGRFWVDQRIRGAALPPRTLASADLAVRVVASFPGAITYTDPGLVVAGVKVLTIDGKTDSDPDYFFAR
jgi:hypothetical protein